MDRPGYITRCPICFCKLIVPDEFPTSERKRRESDPDLVIADHIAKNH